MIEDNSINDVLKGWNFILDNFTIIIKKGTKRALRASLRVKTWEIDLKYLHNIRDMKECLYINYAEHSSFQRAMVCSFSFENIRFALLHKRYRVWKGIVEKFANVEFRINFSVV